MPPTDAPQTDKAEGVGPTVETPREPATEATAAEQPEREGWDPTVPVEADELAAVLDAEIKERLAAEGQASRTYVDEPEASTTTAAPTGGTPAERTAAVSPSSERAAVAPDGGS